MTRRPRIDDLTTFALPEQPALSPDGREVVYVLATVDAAADRAVRSLWRASVTGGTGGADGTGAGRTDGTGAAGRARRLTRGISDSAPAWSPDGTKIAFLRAGDAETGRAQVWVLPADGGEPEQVTSLPRGAGAPAWSPDGRKIAFAARVDLRAAIVPRVPRRGENGDGGRKRPAPPVVTTRLDYRADGAGVLGTVRRHLHVLDIASGRIKQVTEGDWSTGNPVWSPDSAKLAFSAATAPDSDLTYQAPVYTVDVSGKFARPEPTALAHGFGLVAEWSPDGNALFVVGRTDTADGHLGLLRVPLRVPPSSDGDEIIDLAAPLDRNVMPGLPGYPGGRPALTDGGATVLFCVRDRGCTHLYAAPAEGGGTPRPVAAGAGRVISGLSVAMPAAGGEGTRGTAVVVLATPVSYGEIVAVDLATGTQTVLTEHGAGQAGTEVIVREEREFTISDGTAVQGWLVRDPAAANGGPGPLLLDIHGGPHNAWNGAADPRHLYHQELAARGWTVLLLNPRASDGYGEAFYTATAGAWGVADARDFLEPVDALVAEGIADPARLALCGYSYGGYMTCFLTSRDGRFSAAVAGGAVTDLTSMAGASDIGHDLAATQWSSPSPAGRDLTAMSPLSQVTSVRTPTLLLHGESDLRCPVGQAEQWHAALRELGVETQLVRYPGASHLFILNGAPSHQIDYNRRIADWVERHTSRPARPRIDAAHWQRRLAVLAERHQIPGAALGILRVQPGRDDEYAEAAWGYGNEPARIEATTDTLWQIGSISKVWTTTLVMQLVDEGILDLDTPVAEVLPELRLGDPEVAKTVTMRHLLTHTSGIDGDVFTDTGRGDDCVEKYVALLADVKQNHAIGATWSYSNSGFVLAGRVVEKLSGLTWDAALRERIYAPLGLTHTVTLPEEAIRFRTAVGHVDVDGERRVAPVWHLPRSLGPAGLICSTPAELLAFARMHLMGGVAPDGTRLLSEESVAAMASYQADVPDTYTLGDSWGVGWIRFGWDGQDLVGHDGNTGGQAAFLRVLPEAGLAVTLLINGGHDRDLYEDLYREIFAELAGVEMRAPLAVPAVPRDIDITPHLGTYERAGERLEVFTAETGPVLRRTELGPLAEYNPDPVTDYPMTAIDEDLWAVREPGTVTWIPVTFYTLAEGGKFVHFGARATPKTGEAA
jgi:dipeptidyl aminopeptidase/acylaminoacyl peptidase/CubicO group peptidase (beta-lactamase class C family)